MDMGAVLAYHALFSLFPTILVILSIFGFVVGPNTSLYSQILSLSQEALPPIASQTVEDILLQLNQDSVGVGLVSFVVLFISASNFFAALDRTFEVIWRVKPEDTDGQSFGLIVKTFVKKKISSFILVLGAGVVLLVSLLSNLVVRIAFTIIQDLSAQVSLVEIDTVVTLNLLQLASSFVLVTLVLMVLFKVLPSTRVTWQDVWLGAVITAGLFLLLQYLVSRSVISIGSQFHSYGVVGGVMVLMLWIYFTSQVLFWGGEFTFVYARMFGSRRPHKLS